MELKESLKTTVFEKSILKQQVYKATRESFELFRQNAHEIIDLFVAENQKQGTQIEFAFIDRGDFEFEIRFAGDTLIFYMPTDVFEFSRDHAVMKTPYIREDSRRSYCGVIRIYNFITDSFTYERYNDLGYMIGRVFINHEKHYFIEGKRELGMMYNNFNTSLITSDSAQSIVESAIEYATNFDTLTPPYDENKLVPAGDMVEHSEKKSIVTAKRLGFRFQQDNA